MEFVEVWSWRILWGGKRKTTRIKYTEAEIRLEHPEAERVPGSMEMKRTNVPLEEWNYTGNNPLGRGNGPGCHDALRNKPKESSS